jgi:type IV secretion system protein VirB6
MAEIASPIQHVIQTVESSLSSTAATVASEISGGVTPLAASCFSIYMILIVVNYARGASSEPIWDFWLRMAGFAVIIGLGLSMESYVSNVLPIITKLGDGLAAAAGGGNDAANTLDNLAARYFSLMSFDYDRIANSDMGATEKFLAGILWAIKVAIILIGIVPFLVVAAALLIIAKVGVIMVAAVGPIFFACLIFPATRQYFSAWCNAAFSYALIPLFVAIVAMFAIDLSKEFFDFAPGEGFESLTLKAVFMASIVNLLLLLLLKTCGDLASSLSAGGINPGFSAGGLAGGIRRGFGAAAYKGTGRKADEKFHDGVNDAIKKLLNNNNIKAG